MYQTLFYYSFITLYKLAIVSIISTCKMEATQWLLCAGYELSILFTFAEKYSKYQLLDFDISVLNIRLLYATWDIEWYLMVIGEKLI